MSSAVVGRFAERFSVWFLVNLLKCLEGFRFRWLKIKGIDTAFPISKRYFSTI